MTLARTPARPTPQRTGWIVGGLGVFVLCSWGAAACSNGTPMPTTPSGTVAFSACGTLLSNTAYTLTADLSAPSGSCLLIQSAAAVQLDCQQHVVPSITLTNAASVTIRNCQVTGVVSIAGSSTVHLTTSTVAGGVMVGTSQSVFIDQSTLSAPASAKMAVRIVGSTNDELEQNTITLTGNGGFYGVYLANGSGNQVVQNTVTGGYAQTLTQTGSDDGVLLDNESGDTIRGNTISGFYDTAVEGIDAVASTTIANNTMSQIGTAAVGAYWCTSWTNDTITANTVSAAPSVAFIVYQAATDHCQVPFAAPVFTGNAFVNNTLANVTPGLGIVNNPKMTVMFASGTVAGNTLQGNNFGAYDGPFLSPLSGFTDGGGNVCGPLNPTLSNFVCTGPATVQRRWR